MQKKIALFNTAIEKYWESGQQLEAALKWVDDNAPIYDLSMKDKYEVGAQVERFVDCIKKLEV